MLSRSIFHIQRFSLSLTRVSEAKHWICSSCGSNELQCNVKLLTLPKMWGYLDKWLTYIVSLSLGITSAGNYWHDNWMWMWCVNYKGLWDCTTPEFANMYRLQAATKWKRKRRKETKQRGNHLNRFLLGQQKIKEETQISDQTNCSKQNLTLVGFHVLTDLCRFHHLVH